MSAILRKDVFLTQCDCTATSVHSRSQWRVAAMASASVCTRRGCCRKSIGVYFGSSRASPASTGCVRSSRSYSGWTCGVCGGCRDFHGKARVCLRISRTPSVETRVPSASSSTRHGIAVTW